MVEKEALGLISARRWSSWPDWLVWS